MLGVLAALAALAVSAQAAVVGGMVRDHFTGRPLARALVTLKRVDGQEFNLSAYTNRAGVFSFTTPDAGAYLLTASRTGFAVFKYGQQEWHSAARPLLLDRNTSLFLDFRLRRLGAVAGSILDENEIGIPEQDVMAYRATRPPLLAARARTDERGVYRIHGLEPGRYYIRTAAKQLEDGSGLVPTFHKESAKLEEARAVDVALDQQVDDVDIRPLGGALFRLAGQVFVNPPHPVSLSLVSDTGKLTVSSDPGGKFSLDPVPPGTYEIEAETQGYRRPLGAWRQLVVDNHNEGLQIGLRDMPEIRLHFEDGKGNQVDPKLLTVLARRRNLAGAGPAEPLRLTEGKAFLSAGRWELTLAPSPAFYCEEFAGPGRTSLERGRADGWNEILVLPGETAQVRFTLSLRPASIRGRVTASLDTPAPGAPVYLEAYDLDSRRRLTDLRSARTDLRGHYRFDGLAPGKYRLLSSFEFEAPDSEALDHAGGKLVSVSEGSDLAQDLDLYVR